MTTTDPETVAAEIQGNILRAYGSSYSLVRHLVLQIQDRRRAQALIASLVDEGSSGLRVTTGQRWTTRPDPGTCLNIGFTFHGLAAIGVPPSSLDTFPPEFRDGMVQRASVIGDVGANAPEHWRGGLNHPERVDVVVTLHAATTEHLDDTTQALLGRPSHGVALVGDYWDGRALASASTGAADVDHTRWAAADEPRVVHFGYVDGVSQPRFEGIEKGGPVAEGGYAPLGTVIVGQPGTMAHVHWRIPSPHVLGRSGTFNAFRVLEQDVDAFHQFLLDASSAHGLAPDLVAAKVCGRHPDGTPLADVDPVTGEMTFADDPDGQRCPLGAHVRRANPRDATIVQRASNQSRRLVRRGMPYGPPFDPSKPRDGAGRGLLGNFLCANLTAQFESMQFDWINLGFQDPRITGTNDPLVGNHGALDPPFAFCPDHQHRPDETVQVRPPLLVRTVGGAYTFLPSLAGLAHLAAGSPG